MASTSANRRGILAMLSAMALFTANDTLLKLASATYPPGQIMAIRGIFASAIALGIVAAMGELQHWRHIGSRMVLLRAGLEATVGFLFITSVAQLPLANVTAIIQATPIILTLMSVLFGIETVGWRRWSAILVGFAGVLLVVKPTAEGFNVFAGIAFASAVLVAGRDFATRFIGDHVSSVIVTLSTTAAVSAAGFLIGFHEDWRPLAIREIGFLLAAAALVTIGNLVIVIALRVADLSVVSPFRYGSVILSIILGFLVFGDLPDVTSCLGIALIALSGVYTIHRQGVRAREADLPTVPEPALERPRAAGASR